MKQLIRKECHSTFLCLGNFPHNQENLFVFVIDLMKYLMECVLGGETRFLVTFSVEVSDGLLVTNLPAHLINTTELKIRNSNQWQPLQTYVTISKHFMAKANGIRFQGTVNDCNSLMQQLFYQGVC